MSIDFTLAAEDRLREVEEYANNLERAIKVMNEQNIENWRKITELEDEISDLQDEIFRFEEEVDEWSTR